MIVGAMWVRNNSRDILFIDNNENWGVCLSDGFERLNPDFILVIGQRDQ
jgi:hypothetical protein